MRPPDSRTSPTRCCAGTAGAPGARGALMTLADDPAQPADRARERARAAGPDALALVAAGRHQGAQRPRRDSATRRGRSARDAEPARASAICADAERPGAQRADRSGARARRPDRGADPGRRPRRVHEGARRVHRGRRRTTRIARRAGRRSATCTRYAANDERAIAEFRKALEIDPKLAKSIAPGDTVFIFARDPDGSRMPLAAMKLAAAELPRAFVLTDEMAMNPVRDDFQGGQGRGRGAREQVRRRAAAAGRPRGRELARGARHARRPRDDRRMP